MCLKNPRRDRTLEHLVIGLFATMVLVVLMDIVQFALDEDPVPMPSPKELAILKAEQCTHWNHYGLPTGEYGPCPKPQPRWFSR